MELIYKHCPTQPLEMKGCHLMIDTHFTVNDRTTTVFLLSYSSGVPTLCYTVHPPRGHMGLSQSRWTQHLYMTLKAWGSRTASNPSTVPDDQTTRSDITNFWCHTDEPMKAEQVRKKREVFRQRTECVKKRRKAIN